MSVLTDWPFPAQEEVSKYDSVCDEAYLCAKKETAFSNAEWLDSPWTAFFSKHRSDQMLLRDTSVSEDVLQHIGHCVSAVPDDFVVHGGESTWLLAVLTVHLCVCEASCTTLCPATRFTGNRTV